MEREILPYSNALCVPWQCFVKLSEVKDNRKILSVGWNAEMLHSNFLNIGKY